MFEHIFTFNTIMSDFSYLKILAGSIAQLDIGQHTYYILYNGVIAMISFFEKRIYLLN